MACRRYLAGSQIQLTFDLLSLQIQDGEVKVESESSLEGAACRKKARDIKA